MIKILILLWILMGLITMIITNNKYNFKDENYKKEYIYKRLPIMILLFILGGGIFFIIYKLYNINNYYIIHNNKKIFLLRYISKEKIKICNKVNTQINIPDNFRFYPYYKDDKNKFNMLYTYGNIKTLNEFLNKNNIGNDFWNRADVLLLNNGNLIIDCNIFSNNPNCFIEPKKLSIIEYNKIIKYIKENSNKNNLYFTYLYNNL